MAFVRKPLDRLQLSLSKQHSTPATPVVEYRPIQEPFLNRFVLQDVQLEPAKQEHGTPCLPSYAEKALLNVDEEQPIVQFQIYHDVLLSKLSIQLHHVTNLLTSRDKSHQNDTQCEPYVTVQLDPDKAVTHRSQVIRSPHRPTWTFNENFQFEGLSAGYVKLQTLVVRVYRDHSDATKYGECLGVAYLPLADAELHGVVMQMILNIEEVDEVCVLFLTFSVIN